MSNSPDFDAMATETMDLTREMSRLLKGRPREVQGAALADLLALWLAGHQGEDIDNVREQLLAGHINLVRQLLPGNDQMIKARRATKQ